nr:MULTISPECIES: hypothetical protein [Caldicellulosiruptor]
MSKKFNLGHIIACFVYKVKNKMKSLKELEYKINEDEKFKQVIKMGKSLEHLYFSKLAK